MRLVLVHDWLTGMRGGEKCLEVLCRRYPAARLFTLVQRRGAVSPTIERMQITTSRLQSLPGAGRWHRGLLPLMPWAIERMKIPADTDLVVSLSHAVAKGVRVPPGVPHICYCFTPMRYAWERRDDYRAALRGPIGFVANRILDHLREWDRAAAQRVTQFVAISQTVAERIAACYGRPSQVIYPPVEVDFYTPDAGPREDYYVCVSALVPYKRLDVAIAACNRLGKRLVIIGEGPQRRQLARLAGPTVELLGWRSNEEIRERLRRGRALLFPAFEDFGIVPLEAQACGMPVLAYGRGGAVETVLPASAEQPGTGILTAEQTPAAFCAAIEQFERQADCCDAALARRQAERFAAARFERELCALIDGAASGLAPSQPPVRA